MDPGHFAWLLHRCADSVSLLPAEGYLLLKNEQQIELPKTEAGRPEENQTQTNEKTKGTQTQADRRGNSVEIKMVRFRFSNENFLAGPLHLMANVYYV